MQITSIKGTHVSIPLAVPYKLSRMYGTVTDAHAIIVEVKTDTGLVGYGEADPHTPFTQDTVPGTIEAIRDLLAPELMGDDPREIKTIDEKMDGCLKGSLMAKGALDMAMYDLAGKSYGVPVHNLLGDRKQDSIMLSFPLGNGSADDDAEVIEARRPLGFRSYMAKMGRNPIANEIERMKHLTDRYADKIQIVADANQGWREEEAITFIQGVEGTLLELIEQPLKAHDFDGLRRVREASSIPVSADESVVTVDDALKLICHKAVDVFSVKASKNGGITKALRIIAIAEAAQMQCRMNSMLEFGVTQAALLHLGAVTQKLIPSGHAYMSTLRMADDFTDFKTRLRDGYAHVSDEPGLGITVDEAKLAKYAKESFAVS